VRANRLNAKRSTGPRTHSGKARVSQNALKHGLSIPAAVLPAYAPEIEKYLAELVDETASEAVKLEAAAFAQAQVDVDRARIARHLLLADPKTKQKPLSQREVGKRLNMANKYFLSQVIFDRETDEVVDYKVKNVEEARRILELASCAPEAISLAEGMAILAPTLWRLWRYEVRALRKRDQAAKRLLALKLINEENLGELLAS
jgi:hypothetical protein